MKYEKKKKFSWKWNVYSLSVTETFSLELRVLNDVIRFDFGEVQTPYTCNIVGNVGMEEKQQSWLTLQAACCNELNELKLRIMRTGDTM